MPQSDVCATSHKGLISQLNNTIVREQACDKYKVSPSTRITINLNLPLELVHRGKISTLIDLDIKSTLLIMDTMIWKELTLQSLYLTTANGFQ